MSSFKYGTLNPLDPMGTKIEITIPGDLIERFHKTEPVKYENFRAVKKVLDNPLRIFSGVRTFNEGGWCYVGRPDVWCVRERVIMDFPKHLVFAVYVNPAMFLYEFRGERADSSDPLNPINWEDRYGGVVWKSTS